MVIVRQTKAEIFESIIQEIEKDSGHTPTPYQIDIFESISRGQGHLVVNAVAGSGKTSTILDCLRFIPSHQRVLFVAFNKHIADEISRRNLPRNARARTLHSIGLQTFPNRPEVSEWKCQNIFEAKFWSSGSKGVIGPIKKTISLLRNFGFGAHLPLPKESDINRIVDRFGIEVPALGFNFCDMIQDLLQEMFKDTETIDFDDMLYLPVKNNRTFPKYDYVFVDESQDLNPIQIEIVKRLMIPGSRAIFVGDRNQAIYGFRGADPEAMKSIEEIFEPQELPLSICWRCPKLIVEKAGEIVPEIEANPDAPDGSISDKSEDDFDPREGDYVLCRTTAPLVERCLELIREGIPACVRGRDIGKNLLSLLKKIEKTDYSFPQSIKLYGGDEIEKLKGQDKNQGKIVALMDRIETLEVLASGLETYEEVREKIDEVFSDSDRAVTFSTIHKAKGLEADRIFILRPDLLPHPLAEQPWEREQERNLSYVAITRARSELIYVHSEPKERTW